ncbi:hypothetical protein BJY52DRAFT_1197188 [Lactarius psammicola]|nr:hypothetical protein BJY52DRAFT_1197188 [Lactarius psammicola]
MLCRLLAGLLITSRRLAVLTQASTVVWNSPTPGDRFSSGDTIIGKWQTPEKVVSPSFGLCTAGENDCGATVWPEVKESAGYYLVSLAVPNVNKESAYYLQMKDDFSHTYSSPIFTLTSYLQNENNPAAVPPDVVVHPQSGSDQAPMSSVTTPSPNGAANSPNPAPADPAAPPALGPSSVPHPVATPGPLVAAAHGAPPAAALAVPLSLAGAIIVLAGGLALHHRRRLAAEKERAREKLARSTSRLRFTGLALNLGSGRGSGVYKGADDVEVDVEKALFARGGALFRGGGGFFPDHATDAHHSQVAGGAAPLYPYDAPEPRQRTRQLAVDLLPTLGYRRPRPPPPPLSSSSATSSLRRGYFSDVDRNRSRGSGSSNGSGGGSLWRSLSTSRHRRKATPPSTLASLSMTESVTSEVLSSYLPSPDFVDQGHRGHGAGDFEFENVPLSPLPPPPLHTRDGTAEPDDPRMKELRGVYEAVARALGSTRVG